MTLDRISAIIDVIAKIPDHIHALVIILVGGLLTVIRPYDTTSTVLLSAGLAMWRGVPSKSE